MTILYFIIALGILVLVHEWGHFIVARRVGIRVEKFSVGFGPKIFSVQRGDTEYRVSLLPLGGYVKLYGEDPVAEAEGNEAKAKEIASSNAAFASKPLRFRLMTVVAGPLMNLVLCFFLMPVVFMVGRNVPAILDEAPRLLGVRSASPAQAAGFLAGDLIRSIDSQEMEKWSDVLNWVLLYPDHEAAVEIERNGKPLTLPLKTTTSPMTGQHIGYAGFEPMFFWGNDPVVGGMAANSPAGEAGLKVKDRIVSVNGKGVKTWDEMTEIVRGSGGGELTIRYAREGRPNSLQVKPVYSEESKVWMIGITKFMDPSLFVKKRVGFLEAVREGTRENVKLFFLTGDVLKRLFTFQLSYKALGGPLQIAEATGIAARAGFGEFLYFMAFLSLQLGVLNLLPIPVLDGGHVLFMAIEGVRKKPLSLKARSLATQAGLYFLLLLMVLITVNDVDRMWGFADIWGKIRGIF